MLPRENRLAKNADVERAVRRGYSFSTPLFALKAVRTALPRARFTVVAGLAVSKSAVQRNRVKRQVREAIRALLPHTQRGVDIAVLLRPTIVGKDSKEISATLQWAFRKVGLVP